MGLGRLADQTAELSLHIGFRRLTPRQVALCAFVLLVVSAFAAVAFYLNGQRPIAVIDGIPPAGKRTVASAQFTYPQAAIEAPDGAIYIANSLGLTVERVKGDEIETVLGQLPGNVGDQFNRYVGIALDEQGGLLVADSESSDIHRLDLGSMEVSHYADGPPVEGGHFFISSVQWNDGRLLISGSPVRKVSAAQTDAIGPSAAYEWSNGTWRQIVTAQEATGEAVRFRDFRYWGDGGYVAIAGTKFVTIAPNGERRSVDIGSGYGAGIVSVDGGWLVGAHTRLLRITEDLSVMEQIPLKEKIANIANLSFASDGNLLITDSDRQSVFRVDIQTSETLQHIGNEDGALKIVDFAEGPDGSVLMLENASPRIYQFDVANRELTPIAGNGAQIYSSPKPALEYSFQFPNSLDVGPDGAIFVSEANYRIAMVKDGEVTIFAGDINAGTPVPGQHRTEARFGNLRGLDVDDLGRVWIVDRGNNAVWRIETDGTVTHIMGNDKAGGMWVEGELAVEQPLRAPQDVLVRKNGTVLISDTYNSTIVEIGADGRVSRFAGIPRAIRYQGLGNYSGDSGPALEAELNTPLTLSEGSDGSIYIMDSFNNRVRRVSPDGIISTVMGGKFGISDDASRINHAVAAQAIGRHLYLSDTGNSTVWSLEINNSPEVAQ